MAWAAAAASAPRIPSDDAEVVETLPAPPAGSRSEDRALRRALAERPGEAALAQKVAQRLLDRSRELGDPRYAGQALAALGAWTDAARAPDEILLLQATLRQHLHEFDPAAAMLEQLVRRTPGQGQAWLTLATIRRLQGRLDASDTACRALAQAGGAAFHATACLAENEGLRGRVDNARAGFARLLRTPGLEGGARGWLLTSQAELEDRAGRPAEAEVAWRAALAADRSLYQRIAYADHLIDNGRAAQVEALLVGVPRSDAVLLRVAIAEARLGTTGANAAELRARFDLANQRADGLGHHREQAMFALWVDRDARRALELAQRNARAQREPADLRVRAQAAAATRDAAAIAAVEALRLEVGIVDLRRP